MIRLNPFISEPKTMNKTYQILLNNKGSQGEIYYDLGLALLNSGKFQEAARAFQVSCTYPLSQEHARQVSKILFYLGLQFSKCGLLELSLNCYLCSLVSNPSWESYECLGKILKSLGYLKEYNSCKYYTVTNNLLKKPFSFQDWKDVSCHISTNNKYVTVYSPEKHEFKSPKTSDLAIHEAFNPYSQISVKTNTGILVEIPNGSSQIGLTASACLSEQGRVIEEISTGSYGLLYFSQALRIKEYRKIDGVVAMCCIRQNWGAAYYHWMIEVLPYFLILNKEQNVWKEIDYFFVNSLDSSFQKESLKNLGIDTEKVITSNKYPKIQARKMYVPFQKYEKTKIPSREVLSRIKQLFLDSGKASEDYSAPKDSQKFIYISRSRAKYRKIVNEADLNNFLESLNFKVVHLETMSVSEQAEIIHNAQVIIAPHGAGLTNIVFANPGTVIVEIFSPTYVGACYWLIAQVMKLKYCYFVANHDHKTKFKNECMDNINVDINKFRNFLKMVLPKF